jgi:VanZ family protein
LNPGESTVGHSRRRLYFSLLVTWVVFTFFLTSLPGRSFHLPFRVSDKAVHFVFYGVMGFLCALWRRESGVPAGRAILSALLFTAVAGVVDEVHQHWIPGRSMELLDWMADTLGGGIGAIISVLLPRLFPSLITEW